MKLTSAPLAPLALRWLAAALPLSLLALLTPVVLPYNPITWKLLWQEDLPALGAMALFWAAAVWQLRKPAIGAAAPTFDWSNRVVAAMAAAVFLLALIGHHLFLHSYPLSGDEFMATFDSKIFASGHVLAPIEPQWRLFSIVMQPFFLHDTYNHTHWSSDYLPMNAAFQALMPWGIANALWAAAAVAATFIIARDLWPERRDAAFVAAALLATSSQVVVMAMTPYAMSSHLGLNMIWLALFMRRGVLCQIAAACVAFAAVGLHQLIFHPLFAAPFVLQLWLDRRWRRATFHTVAYLCIGLFWASWWPIADHLAGAHSLAGPSGVANLIGRVVGLLHGFQPKQLELMTANLARLIAWQNVLTIALALLGARIAWKSGGVLRALAAGMLLTLIAIMILMPDQTQGWGYRYAHGLLGGICLIATQGWLRLETEIGETPARRLAIAGAVFSVAIMPFHIFQAYAWTKPFWTASAQIRSIDADVVLVDASEVWYGGDLVRNDPLLRNRPKVISLEDIDSEPLDLLCSRYTVGIYDKKGAAMAGLHIVPPPSDSFAGVLREHMAEIGCGRPNRFSLPISGHE